MKPELYVLGNASSLRWRSVKLLSLVSRSVVRILSVRMNDTVSSVYSSGPGMRKLVLANIACSVSKNRDELSISSACARVWSVVPRNASVDLFSSPVGERRSIQMTESYGIVAKSASDWETIICPFSL